MARKTKKRPATKKVGDKQPQRPTGGPSRKRRAHPAAPKKSGSSSADAPRTGRPEGGGFPIVAIGASAGGLDALKRFLAAVPADSGIAFVLIPHLDPRHESMMVELLSKCTSMTVQEAEQRARIRPNNVYVIPPNRYLAIKHGALELSLPPGSVAGETAIDFALYSLADDQKSAAIGIILSGTGSHGVSGVKKIKLAGGVVLVQDPETAEFDQMPRNALATGVVDYALPPERMPEILVRLAKHSYLWAEGERPGSDVAVDGLRRVLLLLQACTKHDFRCYRKNMIARRIHRRMALLQIDNWETYIEQLREDSEELTALFQDLLIGVTGFFRDRDAFDALAELAVPRLVERASLDAPVRVWVPGCASGEEAYSIAILIMEAFRAAEKTASIQIFATDVDERALETARRGIYPDSIVANVTPQRLRQFFVKLDKHHYQVGKMLRDAVVFAPQNLIGDAPFSKLDLISCRNVMIYLEPEIQEKVISLLHFALNEDGYLLLGPSESVGRAHGMFEAVSKKWRLYRRIGPRRRDLVRIPVTAAEDRHADPIRPGPIRLPRTSFTQLMQTVLADECAPASALINRDFEILAVQGPLVNYLEFPAGAMTRDLLMMARQGLRVRIRAACQKALREGRTVSETDARVRCNGGYVPCVITARPLAEPKEAEGLVLVVFQDRESAAPSDAQRGVPAEEESSVVAQLENELRSTREDLQTTIEELETSNEELMASNEEIVSMNEELQSTNEELETSKEELQSLNEELSTVNSQLQDKVEDLDHANNDLTNLMAATGIATVFLDERLGIKRFTPPTAELLNLMPADIGRPFRDFAPRFDDADLLADAEQVLKTLVVAEKEIRTHDDQWYLRRILPYRSGDNRIGGVVITFVDITKRVAAEAQASRLATMLLDSRDVVTVCDLDGRITAWNESAEEMFGYSKRKALLMNVRELVPDHLNNQVSDLLRQVARGDASSFETKRIASDGRVLDVWLTATPLKDENGKIVAVATIERDITARHQTEKEMQSLNAALERRIVERTSALQASELEIRSVLDAAVDAIIAIDAEGTIETFNKAAEHMFGYSSAEAIGQNVAMLMPSPYRENHDSYLRRYRKKRESHVIGRHREFRARRRDGTEFPVQLSVNEIGDGRRFTGIIRDITELRTLREEIVRIATLEQRRIGEELHDNAQQELTGLGLLAENLSDALAADSDGHAELAARLAAGISEVNRHIRSLATGLIPAPVDAKELMTALEKLVRSTEAAHGIRCRFECSANVDVRDDDAALHLYRIAQEAVNNAVKHSLAVGIVVRLRVDGQGLRLEIEDDGIGIGVDDDAERHMGLGLRIMAHRCNMIGGALTVRPRDAAGGTLVRCSVRRAEPAPVT